VCVYIVYRKSALPIPTISNIKWMGNFLPDWYIGVGKFDVRQFVLNTLNKNFEKLCNPNIPEDSEKITKPAVKY
jgi:hypothetical protein